MCLRDTHGPPATTKSLQANDRRDPARVFFFSPKTGVGEAGGLEGTPADVYGQMKLKEPTGD